MASDVCITEGEFLNFITLPCRKCGSRNCNARPVTGWSRDIYTLTQAIDEAKQFVVDHPEYYNNGMCSYPSEKPNG